MNPYPAAVFSHPQGLAARVCPRGVIALALQYFVLAMRRASASPLRVKEYFSRAIRWRDEAAHAFPRPRRLSATLNLN